MKRIKTKMPKNKKALVQNDSNIDENKVKEILALKYKLRTRKFQNGI